MIKMKTPRFLRADTPRLSRLGKNRKKLQKWRRPRGKHNKLRLKRTGHPLQPGIGYGTPRELRGKIKGSKVVVIQNLQALEKLNKNSTIIIARTIGAKKKLEIIKKAQEMNINIINLRGKK